MPNPRSCTATTVRVDNRDRDRSFAACRAPLVISYPRTRSIGRAHSRHSGARKGSSAKKKKLFKKKNTLQQSNSISYALSAGIPLIIIRFVRGTCRSCRSPPRRAPPPAEDQVLCENCTWKQTTTTTTACRYTRLDVSGSARVVDPTTPRLRSTRPE